MSRPRSQLRPLVRQAGFTLLELLVVVLILSAIAFAALDSLQADTNHVRFDDTRNRLIMMRDAIIGPRNVVVNGQPVVAGFVADVGRLPRCVQELIEREVDCDNDTVTDPESPRAWVGDSSLGTGLFSGWRGPYVSAIREQSSGLAVFRDGWGNDLAGAPEDYGWSRFDEASGDLTVQSLGRDGLANPSSASDYANLALYEQDFPPTADPTNPTTAPDPLIDADEHSLTLDKVAVTLRNDTAATITVAVDSFCLRLYRPDPDASNPSILAVESASAPDSAAVVLPPSTQSTILVDFNPDIVVPWGRRALRLFQYSGGTCQATEYNGHPMQQLTLIPQAAFPEIVWAAQ